VNRVLQAIREVVTPSSCFGAKALSGKVESGFPFESATIQGVRIPLSFSCGTMDVPGGRLRSATNLRAKTLLQTIALALPHHYG
jgi:hypothetical protein